MNNIVTRVNILYRVGVVLPPSHDCCLFLKQKHDKRVLINSVQLHTLEI